VLRRIRAVRHSDSGFTLTELLITIIILGVLAAIVVFAVGAFTNDGKQAACQADKRTVQVASDAYRAKNNAYAPSMAALQTANYLKSVPGTSGGYQIDYNAGTGAVTAADVGPGVTITC
jgi:prepilin-type N-terminal cleavage/methylation domain-containing protein